MNNLLNTIPVRTPQIPVAQAVAAAPKNEEIPFEKLKNPYPQIQKYDYLPAKPITPARTTPKFTRPVAASGKIINETFWESAVSTVKAYGNYAKNFYHAAFKGEGDDYKVGKINDLSIRAGSLGIASILATTKFFPFAKGMEFVGLGTWFAAMAVWPQIIGAPIKAMTGVNINQKYEDSYGRRKGVFEDNQYRPMDLFRHLDEKGRLLDEKEYYRKYQYDYVYLDKLADKMGIPRDKKNRHEAAMEKMGQVAVQGRTLTMLTAGVMTPVLSSVVADALQKPVKKVIEVGRKYSNLGVMNKLDERVSSLVHIVDVDQRNTVKDIDAVMQKLGVKIPEEIQNRFSVLTNDKIKLRTEADYNEFTKLLTERVRSTLLEEPVEDYVRTQLTYTEPKVSLDKNLHELIKNSTKNSVKEFISRFKPEQIASLPEALKNYEGLSEEEFISSIKEAFAKKGEELAKNYKDGAELDLNILETNSLKNIVQRKVQTFLEGTKISERLSKKISDYVNTGIDTVMKEQKRYGLRQNKDQILRLFKFIETHNELQREIDNFKNATIANISESITANNWEKLPPRYLDILGFEKAEITQLATMEPSKASRIISKRFESIAANDDKYAKVIKEMSKLASEAITKEENAVLTLVGTANDHGILTKAKVLMSDIAGFNFGADFEKAVKEIYSNQLKEIQYKFRNTSDSFIRPIKALDTFRYIDENVVKILGSNAQEFKRNLEKPSYYMFTNMDYEKAKESLRAFIKDIALDKNDINNWTTKMEHDLLGGKKGMKHSKEMILKIAEIVNGSLNNNTAMLVDADEHKTFKAFFDEKQYKKAVRRMIRDYRAKFDEAVIQGLDYKQITDTPLTFSQKINLNNSILRFRFLNLESKLARDYSNGRCYMQEYFPAESMLKEICRGDVSNMYLLKGWFAELKEQISNDGIKEIQRIIEGITTDGHFNLQDVADFKAKRASSVYGNLDFKAANKAISEMAGKNLTDFIVNAAESSRSRSKWTKTAYGLLLGTTALSAFVISRIGKDNHFNHSVPKKDNKKSQGAGR